ncbi:serum albumin-like [Ascaphus truei]|uniref:serum albumin-like n=1 Tax=Ascaphus truei TaxID=8439 RepID=UPI003F59D4EE
MKWVILISLLFSSTLTESRNVHKRETEDHPHTHIADVYHLLPEEDFRNLVLVMLAQNLQKCSREELSKLEHQITELAKSCVANAKLLDCEKPLITLFLDTICAVPHISDSYDWSKECCAKQDPDRNKCFMSHKDIPAEGVPAFKRPEPEAHCKAYTEHPTEVLKNYIYEVAKRYPHIYAPELLGLATLYNTIVFECCAMEDKAKCFITRMTEHKKLTIRLEAEGQHTCLILRNFGRRTLTAVSLVRVSQKYPKATFDKVQNLTEEITHLFEDCCNGDMMECMVERMELVKHTCENHEELSSKLKYCCEKPLLERSNCIVHLEYDDIPSDLSLKVTEFLEDPKVCKKYDEHENEFLARFLYEYSRTHPEYSTEQLLTIVKVYEGLLDKCCPTETSLECCKDAEAMLANKLKESKTLLETNCAIYQKVGDYLFQNELLVRYTKKMPRVTHKSLIEITHHMTDVGSKCCALPENQKMPCADGGMSKIIGEMCERQKKIHINDKVAHCCNDSYSGRRSCFTGLDVDETYVPPAITDETFHFNADLCTATPEELPTKKQELLITLLKLKPHLVQDQLTEMTTAFTNMSQKCCSADDQQLCFNTEKPILIEHCQRVISA